MSRARASYDAAFRVASAELGMCAASWLFVRELGAVGDDLVAALRDRLGREFPVLDAVAGLWLAGERAPDDGLRDTAARVRDVCAGAARVLVVGIEADALDALVPTLATDARIGLVTYSTREVDWDRVLANYGGRVEGVDLASFQRWAGRKGVLLTFAYGTHGHATHVTPEWLRVSGPDVRTQFRSIVAWEVLAAHMDMYPRWLVEVSRDEFSHVVTAATASSSESTAERAKRIA